MAFFVVSRSGTPPNVPDGTPNQFVLMAGIDAGHATREAAELEAERMRAERPDHEFTVIEAANSMDALVRAQEPDGDAPALEVEVEVVTT